MIRGVPTKSDRPKPTPPWKKSPPAENPKMKLTAESRAWAEARAKKAGRTYPNLVDNMAAAKRQRDQAG